MIMNKYELSWYIDGITYARLIEADYYVTAMEKAQEYAGKDALLYGKSVTDIEANEMGARNFKSL